MPYLPVGIDPFAVPKGDPSRHYRWINSFDQRNLALHKQSYGDRPGYALEGEGLSTDALKAHARALGLNDSYVDVAKGRLAYGELVLASIPRTEHERRMAEMSARQRALAKDVDEAYFERMANIRGVKAFREQVGELHARREHSERSGKPFVSMARDATR